jgi:hypothetical protein
LLSSAECTGLTRHSLSDYQTQHFGRERADPLEQLFFTRLLVMVLTLEQSEVAENEIFSPFVGLPLASLTGIAVSPALRGDDDDDMDESFGDEEVEDDDDDDDFDDEMDEEFDDDDFEDDDFDDDEDDDFDDDDEDEDSDDEEVEEEDF